MAYIPKNRIQPNLYTAGGEYYIPDVNPNYVGFYYKIYTGEVYTGKNPSDTPNIELLPIESPDALGVKNPTQVEIVTNPETAVYVGLTEDDTSLKVFPPQLNFPQPTQDNYQLGEFQRYFCKKRNEFSYLEISESDYNKLVSRDSSIYYNGWKPFDIPWTLTGERDKVYNVNRNIVLLKEQNEKFYGFSNYLQKEYLKYYKS